MGWPLAIPLGGVTPEAYLALLQRLAPGGYTTDPDDPWTRELEAYAHALWIGRVAIDRALAQAFQDRTTELLEEWERAYDLPNDAARTLLERQERLVAAELSTAGASAERLALALGRVAPLAVAHANTREEIVKAAAIDRMIFHIGVQLDATEFDDPAVRRAAARVLRRVIPARLLPVPGFRRAGGLSGPPDSEGAFYEQEGADWNASDAILGRTVLERQTGTTFTVREPPARLKEYGPLVRLDAADLNALQDNLLMGPSDGGGVVDAYAGAGTDMAIVHFSVRISATTEGLVDDSIDWRDRYVIFCLRYDTSDFRPGQAGDTSVASGGPVRTMMSTLDGDSTALTGARWTFGTDLHLYADGNGDLRFYNASGSAVSIVGTAILSPDLGKR